MDRKQFPMAPICAIMHFCFYFFFFNRRLSSVHTMFFPERNMEKSIIALLNLDNYGEVTRLLFLPQARNKCLSLIRLPFVENRKHMISTLAVGDR